MNDYDQPDFYRFNQDSLALVKWIQERDQRPQSIADLGCGCGIIGLELARHFRPSRLVLVELQQEFLPFIRKNIEQFSPQETQAEVVLASFGEWDCGTGFDLIVCNPPYYLAGKGRQSPDANRQLARSFQHENWEILLSSIQKHLSDSGMAAVVFKADHASMREIQRSLDTCGLKVTQHRMGELRILELVRLNKE